MDPGSCRCCLKSNIENEMKNLFEAEESRKLECGRTLIDKLTNCIPELNILNTDPYSHNICSDCAVQLEQSYDFRMLCINANQQLRLFTKTVQTIKIEAKFEFDENDPQLLRQVESMERDFSFIEEKPLTKTELDVDQVVHVPGLDKDKRVRTKSNRIKKLKNTVKLKTKRPKTDIKTAKSKRIRTPARFNEFGRRIRTPRIRKISCDICGYRSTTRFDIEVHMRVHTGERPFMCETCGMPFKTKAAVKKHGLRHRINPIKKHSCLQCSFQTDYKSDYRRHLRLHAGDLPYPCTMCDRRLPCKSALTNHYRIFHADKPHPCSMCELQFRTPGGLRQHVELHYRGTPHICPVCKKLLSNRKSLKRHILKLHPGEKYPPVQRPNDVHQVNVKSLEIK